MTRIDFYLLPNDDPEPRLNTICRLAEKAVGLGQRVHIHADGDQLLDALDDGLWQFRALSFVPHKRLSAADDPADHGDDPVHLGMTTPALDRQLLINLADEVPPFFSRFERTLEILNEDAAIREAGRARYRFYRERGYPLHHHKL